MNRTATPLMVLVAALAAGCLGHGGPNPSFPLTTDQARVVLRDMERAPKPLARPVVVIGGFNDPGFAPAHLARQVRRVSGDRRVLSIIVKPFESIDACGRRVVREVARLFPCDDPSATAEVDVVAFSMGGVVARAAAAPPDPGANRRLRIARLFTISSPHRGAAAAALPALPLPGHVQKDLRPDSPFLLALLAREAAEPRYETCAYVRLGDGIVGQTRASPLGERPHWLSTPPLEGAHNRAFRDPRIVADIARRLRGEEPFASDPPAPLP